MKIFWIIITVAVMLLGMALIANAEECNPILLSKLHQLENLAKKENIHFKVICLYRSPQEQLRLYTQGRTKPGRKITWTKHSKHNEGRAFDVAILINGRITWDYKYYLRLGELGKQTDLIWGGDWKVRDYGHFEI